MWGGSHMLHMDMVAMLSRRLLCVRVCQHISPAVFFSCYSALNQPADTYRQWLNDELLCDRCHHTHKENRRPHSENQKFAFPSDACHFKSTDEINENALFLMPCCSLARFCQHSSRPSCHIFAVSCLLPSRPI